MRKLPLKIRKIIQISFVLYLVGIASVCSSASLQDNLFREMVSLTLSQITKTQVKFRNFDASFSPKIRFKLGQVEFKKNDKTLLSAKTLWLEPSPMFLLSWRKTPSSKAFMNFSLEEGKTEKIDIRKAQGTLRANSETITLESTRILLQEGEILISGDYQKSLKAFDGTITTKQFPLNSLKGAGMSGSVDLNANIQGYISQGKKIIPINGKGKILAINGKIENPSVTKLFAKTFKLNYQDNAFYPPWNFKAISGNFDVNRGIMQANHLRFQGNPLSVEGGGKINFMAQSYNLKFRMEEKLSQNQEKSFGLRGTFKKPQIYFGPN